MSRPPRFLVFAQGGHADGLRAVPFVRSIRKAHPGAHIAVIGYAFAQGLWTACPYIDRFIPSGDDATLGRDRRTHIAKLLRVLRLAARVAGRFDVFVNLEVQAEGGFPGLLASLSCIPSRAGHGGRRYGMNLSPGRADMRVPYEERMCEILHVLDINVEDLGLEAWCAPSDEAAVEGMLAAAGLRSKVPLVVCHTGSDWSCQMWPAARWACLSDELAATGATVACTGLADEADFISEVARRAKSPVLNLAGLTTYGQLCALLARADLVIGLDTLIAPLASAMGTPVVTLAAYDTSNWSAERARELRLIMEFNVSEPVPWTVACHWNRVGRTRGCRSDSCIGRHAMGRVGVEAVMARVRPILYSAGVIGVGR